ncbi:MAG TPA: sigma-70 family RNA polymerase sigma factor [Solirubrobacterales bacterium]|nr:sigma-70 family RNA polymerase sigma factor [Solirubrobacterales bacterium]
MQQARSHSRRPEDADDALSDACVQFLRFYDGPAGEDALRWMMLVTKRCAWAIGRKGVARESRYLPVLREGEELEAVVADERDGTDELVERAEDTAKVLALVEQLKPDERTALILFGLGCTYAEIRELRGWSRTKLHRCLTEGRARVRDLLERGDTF